MKLNLAMLSTLVVIMGIVWQGSAKLTRIETQVETVTDLRADLRQVREDVIVLKSHWQSRWDEARAKGGR